MAKLLLSLMCAEIFLFKCKVSNLPAWCKVIEAFDHGTITVYQDRSTVLVLPVSFHTDAKKRHDTPIPAIVQGNCPFLATGGQQNSPSVGATPLRTCVGTGYKEIMS
jgi:hypothetical protein